MNQKDQILEVNGKADKVNNLVLQDSKYADTRGSAKVADFPESQQKLNPKKGLWKNSSIVGIVIFVLLVSISFIIYVHRQRKANGSKQLKRADENYEMEEMNVQDIMETVEERSTVHQDATTNGTTNPTYKNEQ